MDKNTKKQPKERHEYVITDYYGKDRIGMPCHIYQITDCGKAVYRLFNALREDGSEAQDPIDLFYKRAEQIMEDHGDDSVKA